MAERLRDAVAGRERPPDRVDYFDNEDTLPEYEDGDRVDFATTLSIPDGSQDAVIEAFEAYLAATKRGHFKHNQIASLLHGYKLNLGWTQPDDEEADLIPPDCLS